MKGRNTFTKAQIAELERLITLRNKTKASGQKAIRQKMRNLGFYGKDDWGITDLQLSHLQSLIKSGKIKISDGAYAPSPQVKSIDKPINKPITVKQSTAKHAKRSFAPLVSEVVEILVLGTMPGDRSLQFGEYYAHPRNRFWKIIATITDNEFPESYDEKKKLLSGNKIGLWDVAEAANRKGSLDADIADEIPNDLDGFLGTYSKVKVICFNGNKAATLFAKYFEQNPNIKYHSLPSTSPANTGISFEQICNEWRRIMK